MKKILIHILLIAPAILLSSCWENFLEKKPDQKLVVPTTLQDLQALLDNISNDMMNTDPSLHFLASDDFHITASGFQSLSVIQQNSYLWEKDVYNGTLTVQDWVRPYQQVFYANVVLESLGALENQANRKTEWNNVKGSALFFRALAFYNIAQLFRTPYDESSARKAAGIPLKLQSDINILAISSTLWQTYDQIIRDLTEAELLLPVNVTVKTRPAKSAALALLARVNLSMENYAEAEQYADRTLAFNSQLLDYNTLTESSNKPFPGSLPFGNEEVIFHTVLYGGYSYIGNAQVYVDSSLFKEYTDADLRKTLFFRNRAGGILTFKGSYSPSLPGNPFAFFGGLATDEMYLIRSECRARKGDIQGAMVDLNDLLIKRWRRGMYQARSTTDKEEALLMILLERRKQLVGRSTRWTDLRRLNKDPRFAVSIKRAINGKLYVLAPGDKRYTFPLPDNEVGNIVMQNPR